MQVALVGQTVPHAPQLAASDSRFTHAAPHAVRGEAHAQRPLVQVAPVGQAVPHAPQLAESVAVFTQRPLQRVSPAAHTERQTPAVHTRPAAQGLLHLQQWAVLALTSTHVTPHIRLGAGQVVMQVPPAQT